MKAPNAISVPLYFLVIIRIEFEGKKRADPQVVQYVFHTLERKNFKKKNGGATVLLCLCGLKKDFSGVVRDPVEIVLPCPGSGEVRN
jgi:hypothetical protein